ncbi:MAG: carboxypeptidase M32 [Chloroflexi bacterium]|nr:carboxypeptidase M32 [Chloroflexota bacterium]
MNDYEQFQRHIASINDLFNTINILNWDARTQMPPGGAQTRASQLATLAEIAQDRFAGDTTARLLDAAEAALSGASPDSYEVRAVRQTREAYEVARRIPSALAADMAEYEPVAQSVWGEARRTSNFPLFAPYLSRMVAMQRKLADAIGYQAHPYDALLLKYEPGMTAARLKVLFAELRAGLQPIIDRAAVSPAPRTDFLERDYAEDRQRAFGLAIAQAFGYDLRRGRLDIAAHPFEVSFTREDVRITTRYKRNFLPAAIFGLFHETGHGLYEQGVDPSLTRTALTTDFLGQYAVGGTSYGAHESQSRLWENLVGRSRTFWRHHFAGLREVFPSQLADVDAETFFRAINRVRPSEIRVEADEVTYNYHIMLRVEIEMAMLDGTVAVNDVAAYWRAKMKEYLGVVPADDARGALQDVHWSSGSYGSFCTYTIGNIMSVQLFEAARRSVAGLDAALAQGDYAPLLAWLTDNMYRHGRAFSANEILQRATGQGLATGPYLAYLAAKYADLYPPTR